MSRKTHPTRLFAIAAGAAVALLTIFGGTQAAFAAPHDVVVTPADLVAGTPWTVDFQVDTATWEIVADTDAYFGSDALKLTTPANNDTVGLWFDLSAGVDPSAFAMSYSTKQLSAQSYALPGIFVYVELNNPGVFGAGADVYLGYEPAYNNPGALDTKQWQAWTITPASNVWIPGGGAFTSTSRYGSFTVPFSTFIADPDVANAKVMGVYLNQGSGNTGWETLLDKVNLGADETYNFELSSPIVTLSGGSGGGVIAAAPDATLAATGTDSGLTGVGGVALVLAGVVLLGIVARRRKELTS